MEMEQNEMKWSKREYNGIKLSNCLDIFMMEWRKRVVSSHSSKFKREQKVRC